jgi:hypothetical protein
MLLRFCEQAVSGGPFKDLNAGYKNHDDGTFDSFKTLLIVMFG